MSDEQDLIDLYTLEKDTSSKNINVVNVCNGRYGEVLAWGHQKGLLRIEKSSDGTIAFAAGDTNSLDSLCLGIACLNTYVQANWTGPKVNLRVTDIAFVSDGIEESEIRNSALDRLTYQGEPAYHLSILPEILVFGLEILGVFEEPSSSWKGLWTLRAALVWMQLLDDLVQVPVDIEKAAEQWFYDHQDMRSDVLSRVSLDLWHSAVLGGGQVMSHKSRKATEFRLASQAAEKLPLDWKMTGRMGKRTKFQVDAKAQLIVLARERKDAASGTSASAIPETLKREDDTILEKIHFTKGDQLGERDALDDLDPDNQPHLSPTGQAILLALGVSEVPETANLVHIDKDILSAEQLMAFVERLLSDPCDWTIHSGALLMRSRAECGRTRSVERGILQMQVLADQVRDSVIGEGDGAAHSAISSRITLSKEDVAPAARERLESYYELDLPSWWSLERELADRYLTIGVTRSARDIYERLEMWEDVAQCFAVMGEGHKGIELIRSLLAGELKNAEDVLEAKKKNLTELPTQRQAKLWCVLGELEQKPELMEKSWELSHGTFTRAQRSLGTYYYGKDDFVKAAAAYKRALDVNPLFPQTWFTYGVCEMRQSNFVAALEAFARVVSQDDENAQAWSNLASCHLRIADSGIQNEMFVPQQEKRLAFNCLKHAARCGYENWRIWENLMTVSIDVAEFAEATRAMKRVIEIQSASGVFNVDIPVLSRLVGVVTSEIVPEGEADPVKPGLSLLRPVEDLIVNTILSRDQTNAEVLELYARLLILQGNYKDALDKYIKAYRSAVVNNKKKETDVKEFVASADKLKEIVEVIENYGSRTDADGNIVQPGWKFQCKSMIRLFLKETSAFANEPKYEEVKEYLEDL